MGAMPRHDPPPASPLPTPGSAAALQRTASAWERYKAMMKWMALAALASALLALLYLWASGKPMPIHMVIATLAGVGFSVLLGTALMGLVFLSNSSGHDEGAHGATSGDRDRGDSQ
jgi:RsiW-degrading membrane proteinase PrsW (M82 family)